MKEQINFLDLPIELIRMISKIFPSNLNHVNRDFYQNIDFEHFVDYEKLDNNVRYPNIIRLYNVNNNENLQYRFPNLLCLGINNEFDEHIDLPNSLEFFYMGVNFNQFVSLPNT